MSRLRLPLTCLLMVLCTALLAACGGGSSEDEYKDGMRDVGVEISQASEAGADVAGDATPAERAKAINAQKDAIAAAADKADQLTPPDDAKANHDKLVAALREYSVVLGKLATAAGSEDGGAEAQFIGEVGPIVERLSAASKALEKAGYDFGTDGEA